MRIPKLNWKGPLEKYPMENYPDYEPGKPPRFEKLAELDYLDEVERIWGQRWGEQGIGRLKEVALVKPSEHEVNALFLNHPEFFMLRHYLRTGKKPNFELLVQGIEDLAKVLSENGVSVRWMEFDDVMGAYGPMRKLFVATNLGKVTRAGAIIGRRGHDSYNRGIAYYSQKFFTEIGCPVIMTVTGKGIFEGAFPFVAENICVGSYGIGVNQEAMDQVLPVFNAAGIEAIMGHSTSIMDSFESGGDFHMDMVLGVADLGLVTVFPAQLDYEVFLWLKSHGFKMIEVPLDEQIKSVACNGLQLEPGKVIMPQGAKKTNIALRKEGVDVIEVDVSDIAQGGVNGIRCVVLALLREPGPSLNEIRR